MIIRSSSGTEHVRAEYTITRDINGIPTLETEYFQPVHHHVDPIEIHIKDSEDKYIVVINESDAVIDSNRVKLTAVHSLIYDFTGSRIYDEITQHFSIEQILGVVFNDTDYTFEVAGDRRYYAMQFENFGGGRTRLELLNQICNRWEAEWDVVGNKVYIKDKVGADGSENKKFRYLMNIHDSRVEFDITQGATFIKGEFGKKPEEDEEDVEDTSFELEYTHELAEQYGIRHAQPYSNENITTLETAEEYLKRRVEDTWRLTIDIDVIELESSSNEEYFLGDTVWAIDERIGIDMQTRIIKIVKTYNVDDQLLSTNVILGNQSFIDYVLGTSAGVSEYVTFEDLERESLTIEEEIVRKIAAFDDAFNRARDEMRAEYNQGLADARAEIEALDERMSTEIANEIASFETEFNLEVQAAKDLAAQQIADETQRIENIFIGITDEHDDLIQQNRDNIADVNDFIGDKTVGLNELLYNERMLFEEKLNNVDTWHYNILRGTRFDEGFWQGSNMEIANDGSLNYFEFVPSRNTSNVPYIQSNQEVVFNAGETYTLSFDFQTFSVSRSVNYIFIIASVDDGGSNMNIWHPNLTEDGTHLNTSYGEEFQRYWVRFKPARTIRGFVRIGLNIEGETRRGFKLALPYLTQTDNTRWLYNQLDNTQNIEEITRRVNQLEDGREEFITRTQYDFETGQIDGTIRSITDTVDGVQDTIQNHENWILTNGSSIERTVDGFDSKVWLSDIHNPNMIPHSAVDKREEQLQWDRSLANVTGVSWGEWFQVTYSTSPRSYLAVHSPEFSTISGETYTLSFESWENGNDSSNTSGDMDYVYLTYRDSDNQSIWADLNRNQIGTINGTVIYSNEVTFVANATSDTARMLIGTRVVNMGQHSTFRFRRPKLELGDRATPYYTAFSGLTQRVDEIGLLVQDIDGSGLVRQSDITVSPSSVRIGSTEILGDDVLSSVLNVSPSAIDVITQKMRLSGDLYVDGDITALAVTAIEGNFARLFASEIETVDLNASNITTGTLSSARLQVNNALINRLISNSILTSEMRAQSLTAVRGDIADLRTRILTSNVIISDHINVNNALIDKLFAREALISRLTSKSAFISQLQTIDLTADQVRVGFNGISSNVTINSSGVDISGGALTIRRPDGAVWMQNGIPRYQLSAQVNQFLITGSDATWTGSNYRTSARSLQTVANIYTIHEGRYLDVHVATSLTESSSNASVNIEVQISGFGYTGASSKTETIYARRGGSDTHTIITIDMGVPTYNDRQFYVRFGLASDTSANNHATMRINRAVVRG